MDNNKCDDDSNNSENSPATDHETSDDDYSFFPPFVVEIAWQVTWCKAFPTLLPCNIYCDDDISHVDQLRVLAYKELINEYNSENCSEKIKQDESEKAKNYDNHSIHDDNDEDEDEDEDDEDKDDANNNNNNKWSDCLGYGEISPKSVFFVLSWISQHQQMQRNNNNIQNSNHNNDGNNDDDHYNNGVKIIDLGSGTGRVIMASSLCFSSSNCCKTTEEKATVAEFVGIEIVPSLHQQALEYQQNWTRRNMNIRNNDISFLCTDFTLSRIIQEKIRSHYHLNNKKKNDTNNNKKNHQSLTIFFIHATLFSDDLMSQVQTICEGCCNNHIRNSKNNSFDGDDVYFVMITRPLKLRQTIETLKIFKLPMSWGSAMVFVQRIKKKEKEGMNNGSNRIVSFL